MTALNACLRAGLCAAVLLAFASAPAALAEGKGSDIGGPAQDTWNSHNEFGFDPDKLSDAEKQERLELAAKDYEELRRNQDIPQVRTRRTFARFLGAMHYEPCAPFLKKMFEKDRNDGVRVAAMEALGKTGANEVIKGVVKSALSNAKKDPVFASALPRMFEGSDNHEIGDWLLTKLKQNEPDVLASVIGAIGATGTPNALEPLREIVADHKDVAVRFECLRAIGRCGKRKAVSQLFSRLTDEDWRIRMAAAEGLRYAGEIRAVRELESLIIGGEEPIVVETATEAVGELAVQHATSIVGMKPADFDRNDVVPRDAIPLLINCLHEGRLRARNKARGYLRALAQKLYRQKKDYDVDAAAWESWWKKVKKGIDPDDVTYNARETAAYFRFKIHSDQVLFILDISGSMNWPRAPQGTKPSAWKGRRIDLAHEALFKTIDKLSEDTRFNVATFSGVTMPWVADEDPPATKENRAAAIDWLRKQGARGGTATYDALEFGILETQADTIYFLSDGVPSLGKFEERERILAEIRKVNRFRRVSISTIAFIKGKGPERAQKYEDPQEMGDFLRRLAEDNFGEFEDESNP